MSATPDWKASLHISYGWVIIGVAALAMVATLPGRTHGLAYVTERVLEDPAFHLTRVEYSELNFWASILGGLFCLPCGILIDRMGLRIPLVVTVLGLAAAVFWMTKLAGNGSLFVAILLTRGFGQSALSVISITMVGKWYRGRLSLPMAIYSLVLSLGFAEAARWAKAYADFNWRVLWNDMGWMLLAVMAPLALLLARDPPAGANPGETATTANDADITVPGFTLTQAMQTPAFWVFGCAISVVALTGSGISLFYESILSDQGFSRTLFYDLLRLAGYAGFATQIPVGWLARHFHLGRMQAIALATMSLCLFALPHLRELWQIGVYAVAMSICGTVTTVLFFTIWGQAYGRAHLGRIQAVAQMLTVLASAVGPIVMAMCKERTGSYTLAFPMIAGSLFVIAAASWIVRIPQPEDAARPEMLSQPDGPRQAVVLNERN